MNKSNQEIIWMIAIVIFMSVAMGICLGFVAGSAFPKTAWVEVVGISAQVLATFFTVTGAYWLATKQRRDEVRGTAEAIKQLIMKIDVDVASLLDSSMVDDKGLLYILYEKVNKNVKLVSNFPLEKVPPQCIGTFLCYIDSAENVLGLIESYCNNPNVKPAIFYECMQSTNDRLPEISRQLTEELDWICS